MAKKAGKKKAAKKTSTKRAKRKTARGKAAKPTAKAAGVGDEVQYLLDLMNSHDLTEVRVEDGAKKIVLRRGPGGTVEGIGAPVAPTGASAAAAANPSASAPAEPPASTEADGLIDIPSPMVGTFYAAPSPDIDPYVTPGCQIHEDMVICILEAMKVMNEIKAECSGVVAEICVKNAQPVEFGQVLFRVKPA